MSTLIKKQESNQLNIVLEHDYIINIILAFLFFFGTLIQIKVNKGVPPIQNNSLDLHENFYNKIISLD